MKRLILPLFLAGLVAGCAGSQDREYAERMANEHQHDAPAPSGMVQEPGAEVDTMQVQYGTAGGAPLYGYMAVPEGRGDEALPGVIVIQEWWGLNDNIKAMARRLAAEGYRALAVDMYGGRVATTSEQARQLMQAATQDRDAVARNLQAAHAYLADTHDAPRTGSIGWCFGGGLSLQSAILMPNELDAAVIYYGRLEADRDRLSRITAPVVGFFGEEDEGIPVEGVRQFERTMVDLGKDVEIHVYEDADHAFANPSGGNYQEAAAQDAWRRTLAFFHEHLHGGAHQH